MEFGFLRSQLHNICISHQWWIDPSPDDNSHWQLHRGFTCLEKWGTVVLEFETLWWTYSERSRVNASLAPSLWKSWTVLFGHDGIRRQCSHLFHQYRVEITSYRQPFRKQIWDWGSPILAWHAISISDACTTFRIQQKCGARQEFCQVVIHNTDFK